MVINFDKNNIALHYKRRFGECIQNNDFESAIDYLLKYKDETGFPDFHLACGMLYLQMTRDSDDAEFVYLAYREFMLHVVRHPDCVRAYRNLVITDYMRSSALIPEYAEWFNKRGIELGEILKDIIENTIESEGDPFNFDVIFKPGEYGEIDPDYNDENALQGGGGKNARTPDSIKSGVAIDDAVKKINSKIIAFNSALCSDKKEEITHNSTVPFGGPDIDLGDILRDIVDSEFDSDGVDLNVFDGEQNPESVVIDGQPPAPFDNQNDEYMATSRKLALAEQLCSSGKYDAALEAIADITEFDKKYYFVLAMRALIYLESGDLENAELTLEKARSQRSNHALVGTMLCELYEKQGKTEKIPDVLDNIDITTFMSGDHVYKAFDFIVKYYDEDRLPDLIEDYIEEYNLMNMRLIYAQILYNRGEKEYATEELYRLSRIFYDDINISFFYMSAKLGVDNMPIGEEAPQGMLTYMVDEFMNIVRTGDLSVNDINTDMISTMIEFFISLEFRNERKMLVKMFETVKKLAANPAFEGKARDALVSPYVEPIVKGVILSELLKRDYNTQFLAEVMYRPIPSDCIKSLGVGYSAPYYVAYAFVTMLCHEAIDTLIALCEECKSVFGAAAAYEEELSYYLIKTSLEKYGVEPDERYIFALGFKNKTQANTGYNLIKKSLKNKAGVIKNG